MKKARNSCSSDESDGAASVPSWLPPPPPSSSTSKQQQQHHHHHRPHEHHPPHPQQPQPQHQPPQLKSRSHRFSSPSSSASAVATATMTPSSSSSSVTSSLMSPAAVAATPSSSSSSHRPAEVYRTDLISAMKVPDSAQLGPDEYYVMADAWKPEWEKGVQVPVCGEDDYPEPSVRILAEREKAVTFARTRKYIQMSDLESPTPGYADLRSLIQATCHYDLDDTDLSWLHMANRELQRMGEPRVDEAAAERVLERLERRCQDRMAVAMDTVEGLGIEYDEDVVCDVCRSPDCEEANEMVFCDRCNVCVHQACYGILKVPEGSWLCRSCALGVRPPCLLCPKTGGAMKPTRSGSKWAHVSCALWIPEVSIGCPERMEPVTKISQIPPSRWALVCSLCRVKTGACIQCSVKSCITAFHVTCAFEHGLEMRTTLEEGEEVRFRSICSKHSKRRPQQQQHRSNHGGGGGGGGGGPTEDEKTSLRKQKLQELQEEFFSLAGPGEELAQLLGLPEASVDLLFQYWKLKRRSSFSRPLMDPPSDSAATGGAGGSAGGAGAGGGAGGTEALEDSLYRRMRMFMYLRQDLERVRNLCYMVSRREKLKNSLTRLHEQIFQTQLRLLETGSATDVPRSGAGGGGCKKKRRRSSDAAGGGQAAPPRTHPPSPPTRTPGGQGSSIGVAGASSSSTCAHKSSSEPAAFTSSSSSSSSSGSSSTTTTTPPSSENPAAHPDTPRRPDTLNGRRPAPQQQQQRQQQGGGGGGVSGGGGGGGAAGVGGGGAAGGASAAARRRNGSMAELPPSGATALPCVRVSRVDERRARVGVGGPVPCRPPAPAAPAAAATATGAATGKTAAGKSDGGKTDGGNAAAPAENGDRETRRAKAAATDGRVLRKRPAVVAGTDGGGDDVDVSEGGAKPGPRAPAGRQQPAAQTAPQTAAAATAPAPAMKFALKTNMSMSRFLNSLVS